MKKIIAMLLAVMMVLSLVPMATAEEPTIVRYGSHWTAGWNPNEIDPATGSYTMTDEADRQLRLTAEAAVLAKHNVKIEHVQYAQDVRSELVLSVLAGNPVCDVALMWNGSENTVLVQNILQAGILAAQQGKTVGRRLDVGQTLGLAGGGTDKHISHLIIILHFVGRNHAGKDHMIRNPQLDGQFFQLYLSRAVSYDQHRQFRILG